LSNDFPASQPNSAAPDPDSLEVVSGASHEKLQGWIPELATAEELRSALEQAFDYRGDVLITRKDGSTMEGYIFDRRTGKTLADSFVRLVPKDGSAKISLPYADIAALAFTGRDMAAGNSWEAWVRHYWEKKSAGESDVSLEPQKLG
jgi:hypothetical protein